MLFCAKNVFLLISIHLTTYILCFFSQDDNIPLVLAAEAGNLALGRELLHTDKEEQLKVKRKTNGDTPLHAACRKKDFDFIKLCVDCGANVDAKNVRIFALYYVLETFFF